MNTFGLFTGLSSLLIIGLGFPIVIYSERIFGHTCWPYLFSTGLLLMALSLFVPNNWASAVTGVLGGTIIWGSTELKEQAVRSELGWFSFNKHKIRLPFASTIEKWKAPHL